MKKSHFVYGTNIRFCIIICTVLTGVILLLFSTATKISAEASDREALKGMRSIGIKIDKLSRKTKKLGITYENIITNVVSKLQQAGIQVVTDDEIQRNPSLSFLKIGVIVDYSEPKYTYTVVVGLNKKVSFENDPQIISYDMPWWRIVKGEYAGNDIAAYVLQILQYILNEFVANYHAVNTKEIDQEIKKSDPSHDVQLYNKEEQIENNSQK